MNTTPPEKPAECMYERAGDDHKPYMCGAPAVAVWHPQPELNIFLCKSCLKWLATLCSLGLAK